MYKDAIRHELIGCRIEVCDAKNSSLIGLKGVIIDESKNTLTIRHLRSTKILLKDQITMKLNVDNTIMKIRGKDILGRPEERIKR